jgi:hypothetical protein
MTFVKGQSGNPSGRKKGEVFVSEAVRMLLRGDEPTSDAPVWSVARNVLASLTADRLDSRTLSLVLERLEGKVPDRLEVQSRGQVVLLPAGQLTGQAWIDAVRSETGVELPALEAGEGEAEGEDVP